MKVKLAIAACVAALALPMAPAAAEEAIPGTCYETTISSGGQVQTTSYQCECLVGVPWVQLVPPRLTVLITYCHVEIPRV